MIKSLLYLDENLASSIALRFASQLTGMIHDFRVQVIHVESPDSKSNNFSGYGWVRRSWEKGVQEAGRLAIERLMKTENVLCPTSGPPKITVGDRDRAIIEEMRINRYDVYIEGNLNTSSTQDFNNLINSKLYAKSSCPMLIVKNLVGRNKVVMLGGEGVDLVRLIEQFRQLRPNDALEIDLLYYQFQENTDPVLKNKDDAGSVLMAAEAAMTEHNMAVHDVKVICGTPEKVGEYLQQYDLVVSSIPTRRSTRQELLAHTMASVLLYRLEKK